MSKISSNYFFASSKVKKFKKKKISLKMGKESFCKKINIRLMF